MGQTIAFRGLSYLANPPLPSLAPPHWNERQTTKSDRLSRLVNILLCQPPDQPQRGASIVLALILGMPRIVREVLARRVRIAAHGVEGQRQYGLGECRVGVGILGPAIHQQQKVALPS